MRQSLLSPEPKKISQLRFLCNWKTSAFVCTISVISGVPAFVTTDIKRSHSFKLQDLPYWKQMEGMVCANILFANASDVTACQNSAWMVTVSSIFAVPVKIGSLYSALNTVFVKLLLIMSALSLWSSWKLFSNYLLSAEVNGSEL